MSYLSWIAFGIGITGALLQQYPVFKDYDTLLDSSSYKENKNFKITFIDFVERSNFKVSKSFKEPCFSEAQPEHALLKTHETYQASQG